MIIGLGGTNGAGKDTVGQILAERYNFLFISVTDVLRAEAGRRGLSVERKNLRLIGDEMRKTYGEAVLVEKAIEQFKSSKEPYRGLAVSSLRHPAEADLVHQQKGLVVWVDADPKVRYERVQAFAKARNRAAEDNISFEEFLKHEAQEMKGDRSTLLKMTGVKDKADITLFNQKNGVDDFAERVRQSLKL